MSYSIKIKRDAQKALERIAKPERTRLIAGIDRLREEPLAGSALQGDFAGLRRLRIGDYRIVYKVFKEEVMVLVVRIGHRREVYRWCLAPSPLQYNDSSLMSSR